MIQIIDYGLGNLSSIANMIRKVGGQVRIISEPEELVFADKVILPGVGAFDIGMEKLKQKGWIEPLNHAVLEKGTMVLGICLGMQLMCKASEEGKLAGLGWIDADVKRFGKKDGFKIPHMGWNSIEVEKDNPIIDVKLEKDRFYFVHSFFVQCYESKDVLSSSFYGSSFTSSFMKENIFGVQFHPEKSHKYGKLLFQKFILL